MNQETRGAPSLRVSSPVTSRPRLLPLLALAVLAIASPSRAQDGFPEIQKLLPDDLTSADLLGGSVATSGDVVVAGAPGADAVYVYREAGGSWVLEARLVPAVGPLADSFGAAVAVDGSVLVVGVPFDDDRGSNAGAAVVFRYDGQGWLEEQKLFASDGTSFDQLGGSVSLQGDVILVGASLHDAGGSNRGAGYAFRFDGSQWVEEQKLLASDGGAGDLFGSEVSVWGNVAVVGAPRHDLGAANAGAAYVFGFDGSTWTEEAKLLPVELASNDGFGTSVSVLHGVIAVGAPTRDGSAADEGAVFVFRDSGGGWLQEQALVAGGALGGDLLGTAVSVSQDLLLVGATGADDAGINSGAALVFEFDGSAWTESARLTGSDTMSSDRFGAAVSAGSRVLAAGADLDDDLGSASGSVFLFQSPEPPDPGGVTLAISPSEVLAGENVTFTVTGGQPGDRLLMLVNLKGWKRHLVVRIGRLDGNGAWSRTVRVPRRLPDLRVCFQAIVWSPGNAPERSNEVELTVHGRPHHHPRRERRHRGR